MITNCSNCGEPFHLAEAMQPDGNGGWRHPSKCGAELKDFKVKRRTTKLERQIEELGSRPASQSTLSDVLHLECLEKIQAEREERKAKRKGVGE